MTDILIQFDKEHNLYKGFIDRINQILSEILQQNKINLYSISCRVKSRESLEKKLKKKNSYAKLEDLTDIGGIRITTYFEDDVKKIAALLEQEFDIDLINSIDKKALLDPDRFGYLSMHHVISFDDGRCKYPEYQRYKGLKAEVQTRSILQHAWAEIEHDLGYKTEQGVPTNIRRRFSRLAGLLELADQEFITIRDELETYSQAVTVQIQTDPQDVAIDLVSLRAFVRNSTVVKRLDLAISAHKGIKLIENEEYIDSSDVERMCFFQLNSIAQLETALIDYENKIISFSATWLNGYTQSKVAMTTFSKGISLFYLGYVLAASTHDENLIESYVTKFIANNDEGEDISISDNIIAAFEKINS